MQTQNTEPGEVHARSGAPHSYSRFTLQDALAAPFSLPSDFLKGIRPEAGEPPAAPLIVFINARSGGRDGPELALALSRAVGRVQVFDLARAEHRPDKVLPALWENFKACESEGNKLAALMRSRLRILVAGGDGTIAWVLGVIKSLGLKPAPPVAIMPLGTGNDLARSFGWGPAFMNRWIQDHAGVYCTLQRIALAQVDDLDCWKIRITLPTSSLLGHFPHSLRPACPGPSTPTAAAAAAGGADAEAAVVATHELSADEPQPPGALGKAAGAGSTGAHTVINGLFWNYFSVGLDAKAAYGFHSLRERRPHLTFGRIVNQAWYSYFSCTTGWFCCTKPISSRASLAIQTPGSPAWRDIHVPDDVKALVILNLQSYAGGRNLWGTSAPSEEERLKLGLKEPSYSDGLLEVVGLTSGYHTAGVMATNGKLVHAKRLCQAAGVRLGLRARHVRPDGTPSHAYCQVDGEPWMQDVPSARDEQPIVVEISHHGVSKVLHNHQGLECSQAVAAALARQRATEKGEAIESHVRAAIAAAGGPGRGLKVPQQQQQQQMELSGREVKPPSPLSPHLAAGLGLGSMAGPADSEIVHFGSDRVSHSNASMPSVSAASTSLQPMNIAAQGGS